MQGKGTLLLYWACINFFSVGGGAGGALDGRLFNKTWIVFPDICIF
jgi:hypothetical protein